MTVPVMRKDCLLLFDRSEFVINALSMCLGQDDTQPRLNVALGSPLLSVAAPADRPAP
jgi:hypothetical protein